MSAFGFTFKALYRLEVDELRDLARLIRGESFYPPTTKEALIRGMIVPFLGEAGKAPKDAAKDEAMRAALFRVAKGLKIPCDDREAILHKADKELKKRARRMGLTLVPAVGIEGLEPVFALLGGT